MNLQTSAAPGRDLEARKARYRELIDRFARVRVAVVGDLVADVYVYGRPERLSREAPVLIVQYEREEVVPGCAANAIANLAALGAEVKAVGVIGDDPPGTRLLEALGRYRPDVARVARLAGAPTPTKTRILAGDAHTRKQQVLRIDRGRAGAGAGADGKLAAEIERHVLEALDALAAEVDGLAVCDYGYDLFGPRVVARLGALGRTHALVVDSRFDAARFGGATLVKLNEGEAESLASRRIRSLADAVAAGREIRRRLAPQALLLTRGNQGMLLFEEAKEPVAIPIVGGDDIVDVSGAGDTVASVMALGLCAGAGFEDAARLANYAASVVVMKLGTATLTRDELWTAIERHVTAGG